MSVDRPCEPANRWFAISTPWYHGWNVIAVGILAQAITIGLMTYSFTFWVAPLQSDLGASISTLMLAASLSHVSMAAISPFCGRIVDASAVRPILLGGIVVFALGYFLLSVCVSAWQVILIYATLLPLGAAFAGPLPAQVATVRWFSSNRGMALGITSLGSSIGGFVFPPLVTALVAYVGWRSSHVVLGLFALALMLPLTVALMREPEDGDREPDDRGRGHAGPGHGSAAPLWTIPQLLRSPVLWGIVFCFVPMLTIYLSYKFNLAPISTASGITAQKASYIMALHAACAIGGKLFFGFMADRVEHRYLVWIAAVFLLVSLALPQVSTSYPVLMGSFAALGLAGGGFLPLMGAIGASRFGPGSIGRVIGLMGPLTMLGSFGPSLFAYLYAVLGSYDPVFRILMALVVPTIIAACFIGPAALIFPQRKAPGAAAARTETTGPGPSAHEYR